MLSKFLKHGLYFLTLIVRPASALSSLSFLNVLCLFWFVRFHSALIGFWKFTSLDVCALFEHYYNLSGERTLRNYSSAVNVERFDAQGWMTSEEDVWCVPEFLATMRHYPLFPAKTAKTLPRLDRRSYEAGMHGSVKH